MKRAGQSSLPGVKTDVAGDASERTGVANRVRSAGTDGQLDRTNALARAREDGEREGTIAAFCECAAIADETVLSSESDPGAIGTRIIAELNRRYGASDPRVLHHMKLRGLS